MTRMVHLEQVLNVGNEYAIIYTNKYPTANVFWKYMEENWRHKTHMWVVGFQNLPYVRQNKHQCYNENYHGTLKAQLK
jgi:hypothetical protein